MNDKWLRIIGYPIMIVGAAMVYHGNALWQSWPQTLHALATSGLFTVVMWEGNRWIFRQTLRYLPGYLNTYKRIITEVLLWMLYSTLVQVLLEVILFYWLDLHPSGVPPIDWWSCVFTSLIILIPMGLIYEAGYFFSEWKRNIQQSEALARSQVQAQLDALKKQLDPHFLFNSLNTLAYLIDLDNEPAQTYLERLAKVYRYVLETRQQATVSLADELAFLEDYLYLNQVRFKENLRVDRQISAASYERRVPAMSLQLLVENAIKHNVVSQAAPLHIRILEEGGRLSVVNTKQARSSLPVSTRVGLDNLREQYRLLTSDPVEILDTPATFTVRLPLLEKQAG